MKFDRRLQKLMRAPGTAATSEPVAAGDAEVREVRAAGDWLRDALDRVSMPASPIENSWTFAISSLVQPQLPAALRRIPRLFDRFGVIQLSRDAIAVDSTEVSWRDIVEVRTRSLSDVLTTTSVDGIAAAIAHLLPLTRLGRRPAQWLADQTSDVVLSLFLAALDQRGDQRVPTEIRYRGRRGRDEVIDPGIVATAVLSLPKVAESILTTAAVNGVKVVHHAASEPGPQAEAIRRHAAELVARITDLRTTDRSASQPSLPAAVQES